MNNIFSIIMLPALIVVQTGLFSAARASWNLSIDGDGRARLALPDEPAASIEHAGVALRKTFSDAKADRVVAGTLLEAEETFSEFMVHELWAKYKGPLGKWNFTVGRFAIPYGLNQTYPTSRLLHTTWHDILFGFDTDNGVMISGFAGMFDYAVAATQGLGPHRLPEFPGEKLATGRIGAVFGDAGEFTCGVSFAAGDVRMEHGGMALARRLLLGGADAIYGSGGGTLRLSIDGGRHGDHLLAAGFAVAEYAVHSRIDLAAGLKVKKIVTLPAIGAAYAGATFNLPWLNVRCGYTYGFSGKDAHEITLQLYRLIAFNF